MKPTNIRTGLYYFIGILFLVVPMISKADIYPASSGWSANDSGPFNYSSDIDACQTKWPYAPTHTQEGWEPNSKQCVHDMGGNPYPNGLVYSGYWCPNGGVLNGTNCVKTCDSGLELQPDGQCLTPCDPGQERDSGGNCVTPQTECTPPAVLQSDGTCKAPCEAGPSPRCDGEICFTHWSVI